MFVEEPVKMRFQRLIEIKCARRAIWRDEC